MYSLYSHWYGPGFRVCLRVAVLVGPVESRSTRIPWIFFSESANPLIWYQPLLALSPVQAQHKPFQANLVLSRTC